MPRRKFVSNLKTICLLNIAKNMDDIWCADYAKNFLDKGNFLYLVGPFETLTSDHIQELINILSERKWMKRYYLHLLIDNRLDSLDLSVCRTVSNKDSIVNLVRLRCQKILRLNIGYCNQVSARIIADVVNSAANLQYLNLQRTKCNDQVLSLIGHKLRHIRELNVSSCPITDMGIMSLCVNFDQTFVKCEKLMKLDISNTMVTHKGAQVAIEHLRNLVCLDFPDICDVIYRIRNNCSVYTAKEVPEDQILKLRFLTISQMKAYAAPMFETVQLSVLVCPFTTDVHFMRGVTSESVCLLGELPHLSIVHLGNSDEELITFEDGILPMLQIQGKGLNDLSLHEVNKIDIGAIAACCPNLKKFSCIVAGYPTAEFPMHTHPEIISAQKHTSFPKLEHVKVLIHSPENTFPPQYVKILTVNASRLKSLHMAFVQSLNDTVLDFILDLNDFRHLEECHLESCNNLSGDGIHRLIELCDIMKSLVLKSCHEVTRQDFSAFCKFCSDNNFEMNIQWT